MIIDHFSLFMNNMCHKLSSEFQFFEHNLIIYGDQWSLIMYHKWTLHFINPISLDRIIVGSKSQFILLRLLCKNISENASGCPVDDLKERYDAEAKAEAKEATKRGDEVHWTHSDAPLKLLKIRQINFKLNIKMWHY